MGKRKGPPRDEAVALKYDAQHDAAPKVIAKGKGQVASRIKEIALSKGIPIHRDNDLVELLGQVEIDREIPSELYAAVAEVLSWIYRASRELDKERST